MMDVQEAKDLFRGPMVSVATPFTSGFDLDLDALRDNIEFMLDRGMAAGKGVLLVAAAGGEFPMLSMEERKEVIRASVEAAAGRIPVAASIQFDGTREIIELAHYAHRVGASLGQLSSPSYYPPPAQDIFDLFEAVSEETELPIMIYNNWWTTPNMNVGTVDRLARLPGVVALKWSSSSMGEYTAGLHRFADRLAIIDNLGMAVWAHLLGAVGFITHQSNFWPEYPLSLWELLERKDYDAAVARLAAFSWPWDEWTHRVCEETEGEGPFIKAAMEEVGLAAGPPRPPARPVSARLRQELRSLFADSGVPRANGAKKTKKASKATAPKRPKLTDEERIAKRLAAGRTVAGNKRSVTRHAINPTNPTRTLCGFPIIPDSDIPERGKVRAANLTAEVEHVTCGKCLRKLAKLAAGAPAADQQADAASELRRPREQAEVPG